MHFFTGGNGTGPQEPPRGTPGVMDIPPDDAEKVQIRIRLQELEIELQPAGIVAPLGWGLFAAAASASRAIRV